MISTAQRPSSLAEVSAIVRGVCLRHPVARADLFGSVAHGNTRPDSDVDVLVDFLPEAQVGLLEMGVLREDLAEALGRPVDLVSRHAIERSANPYRRRAILGSAVNIYAR